MSARYLTAIRPRLSLTGRRWILRDDSVLKHPDDALVSLRSSRGLTASDQTERMSDPHLFPEMKKAVDRIHAAINSKETIGIFGDYDADGITATAQLVRFFRRRGIEPVVYLPDRLQEGYGMKVASVDALHKRGVTLLITVDTGIAAHNEILHGAALGIDVIVTDHHRVQGGRPAAHAVIHPLVPTEFPNQNLSGSGVAFMLLRALEGGAVWPGIEEDIVLAMIGTIGDVMPLTGENRILIVHGLKFASKLPAGPLKDLIDDVSAGKPLTSGDIAFRVVPRINAAGRMKHPSLALDAILSGGAALEELHRLNGDRQSAIEDAIELIRPLVDWTSPFLCAASPDVSPGIVGLIAGRLTEESGRPSLIAAVKDGVCIGSLRSVEKIDVMSCLQHPSVSPLLSTFGGHAQAAGCTFPLENLKKLEAALSDVLVNLGYSLDSLLPEISIDHELSHAHLSLPLARALQSLQPFGQGNEEPLFLVRNLTIDSVRVVGGDGTHLQIGFGAHRGIAFRCGSLADQLAPGSTVDIAACLGVNAWNGRESLQLVVKDIRVASR